jgi:DNA replication protein DnaC
MRLVLERLTSPKGGVIVTSNKPFGPWGEVFGDVVVAAG